MDLYSVEAVVFPDKFGNVSPSKYLASRGSRFNPPQDLSNVCQPSIDDFVASSPGSSMAPVSSESLISTSISTSAGQRRQTRLNLIGGGYEESLSLPGSSPPSCFLGLLLLGLSGVIYSSNRPRLNTKSAKRPYTAEIRSNLQLQLLSRH